MGTSSCHYSNQLIDFLIEELPKNEMDLLKIHLHTCLSCQQELEELQQAWQAIPFELEKMDVEVPVDLKQEVMSTIFQQEEAETQRTPSVSGKGKTVWQKFFKHANKLAVAALLLALGSTFWSNLELKKQLQTIESQLSLPAQIVQVYHLSSADPELNKAKGNAWLMEQGGKKKLVLYLQGLSATKGEEAYQVWLIHQGTRQNAGVFRVDSFGNGVLTFEMKEPVQFDGIGITLESDTFGDKPRGKKVLGT